MVDRGAMMATNSRGSQHEHGSERREQILSIAAHLIATHGYSATTVRDIAEGEGRAHLDVARDLGMLP